jgi:hypothetical protein
MGFRTRVTDDILSFVETLLRFPMHYERPWRVHCRTADWRYSRNGSNALRPSPVGSRPRRSQENKSLTTNWITPVQRKRLANYTADDGESLLALAPANGGQLANSVGLAISPPRQDGA